MKNAKTLERKRIPMIAPDFSMSLATADRAQTRAPYLHSGSTAKRIAAPRDHRFCRSKKPGDQCEIKRFGDHIKRAG